MARPARTRCRRCWWSPRPRAPPGRAETCCSRSSARWRASTFGRPTSIQWCRAARGGARPAPGCWVPAPCWVIGVVLVVGNSIRVPWTGGATRSRSRAAARTDAFVRRPFLYHGGLRAARGAGRLGAGRGRGRVVAACGRGGSRAPTAAAPRRCRRRRPRAACCRHGHGLSGLVGRLVATAHAGLRGMQPPEPTAKGPGGPDFACADFRELFKTLALLR